ncbi:hypothetical protein R1flu_009671 [Riccia fluitans]|uniref:ribonuclease Z n=1 Tax=Riccia fluitans TaxID=41844 RepID=A0ABD1Z3V3_9MARC
MESPADSMGYELRLLHAAADGVEPALLISAPGKKAEYLLNVPDGFSRLALEHKSTPSGRLSCILLTSLLPAATGGLGGLMLRLRHDGHGQVQVIGPSGTTGIVHSLRNICRWRHPKVFVSECCGNRPVPVFEDEHIVIVPIVDGGQITGCPWCLYGARENSGSDQHKRAMNLLPCASSNDHSTSSSSDSSLANENPSHSDSSPDEEDVSSDRRGASHILPQRRKREENRKPPSHEEYHFFKQVRLKLDESNRDGMNVLHVLARESCKARPPANQRVGELGVKATVEFVSQVEEKSRKDQSLEIGDSGREASSFVEQSVRLGSEGGKELQQEPSLSSGKSFEWLIHNSQEVELPDVDEEANPVFQLSPSPDKQPGTESIKPSSPSVFGFVCYLRKLDRAVLIVDCDKEEQLESLRAHHLLRCSRLPGSTSQEGDECEKRNKHLIAAVVDLSPRNILLSRGYKLWIDSLPISGLHVVMKRAGGEFGFQSSLATLVKLNGIQKTIFPLPPGVSFQVTENQASDKQVADGNENLLDGALCMRLILQKSGTLVDNSMCPDKLIKLQEERRQLALEPSSFYRAPVSRATPFLSANAAAAAALRRSLQCTEKFLSDISVQGCGAQGDNESLQPVGCTEQDTAGLYQTLTTEQEEVSSSNLDCDFQLVFFGTGCAEPSKKRGSSGILLQVKGTDRAMLIEAGEGVAGQFVRRFGAAKARSLISSLECLWLSHKHGDHVLGVLSILEARREQKEPLVVIGPQKVEQWLSEVKDIRAAMACPLPEFHFVRCQELAVSGRLMENRENRMYLDRVLSSMQLQSLRLIRVFHCFDAYGIILRGKSGWSIVYSGDTRPCKPLEYAGQGCTLLIHEATFEDELIEQAKLKRHCTISEALKTGLQMGAQHIILTHFSQRYPEMVAMCSDLDQRVSVAFDGMVVPSHLLDSLAQLLPSISSVCQKRDKTKRTISNLVVNGRNPEPNNSLSPAHTEALTTYAGNEELLDVHDGSRSARLSSVSLHSPLTCPNTEHEEKCAVAISNHIRWSDSENYDMESPSADPHVNDAPVNWSSDSDEEDPFQLPVLKPISCPHIRAVVEREMKAAARLAKTTSPASGEVNFDTPIDRKAHSWLTESPSCLISREDNCDTHAEEEEDHWNPIHRSRREESRLGFRKLPRYVCKRGGIQSSGDHFLKESQQNGKTGMTARFDNGEEQRPTCVVMEKSKAGGGKHIRWIDSDSEE